MTTPHAEYGPYTNASPKEYVTKDLSVIRELLNEHVCPGLDASLAEAVVEAAQSTAKHRHTRSDEIYYCLEGNGTLHINDAAFPFSQGSFYLLPKNAWHWLEAHTRLRLLCFCSPGYSHEQTVLACT